MQPTVLDVSGLLHDVETKGKFLGEGGNKARRDLLATLRKLQLTLETPIETAVRISKAEPTLFAAIRVGIELKLFEKLKDEDRASKTASQLAKATHADEATLSRILKHLAAMSMIEEVDANTYAPTKTSDAFTVPAFRDAILISFDIDCYAMLALPKYLASTGYKAPVDPTDGPFQLGHDTRLHYFKYIHTMPEQAARFNNFMTGTASVRMRWMDSGTIPIDEILSKGRTDPDAVLLVDMGGGKGQDISNFRKRHPQLPGKLILQDMAATIEDAVASGLPEGTEAMPHDIFTEQPIRGARAYYMHGVLHDWPDDKCREIFKNLIPAMEKGYSKILINDVIVPDKNAPWSTTTVDVVMMTFLASYERTESAWRKLLESAGLQVAGIWTHEMGNESLIQAELA